MTRIDPEFTHLLNEAEDDTSPLVDLETEDALTKFFRQDAVETDGHINFAKLQAETQDVHASIDGHYKKIAATVIPAEPQVTNDPNVLRKRWTVDEKAGYREFFKTHIAKGKTPQAILDGWLAEFPTANPDCVRLMKAVCAEFQ